MFRSVVRTLAGFGAWALLHSVLASRKVKGMVGSRMGADRRNAIYRVSYNGIAVMTVAGLVLYLRRLPDRRLYRIPWPWRAATGTVRLALLGVAAAAAVEIGIGPFSGVSELGDYLARGRAEYEPEAQGPAMDGSELRTGGPFGYVRHPLNASAAAIVLLTPEMTVVRLTVAALTLAYAVVGSQLEERRLLDAYGEVYERYRERVPFFVPRLSGEGRQGA